MTLDMNHHHFDISIQAESEQSARQAAEQIARRLRNGDTSVKVLVQEIQHTETMDGPISKRDKKDCPQYDWVSWEDREASEPRLPALWRGTADV